MADDAVYQLLCRLGPSRAPDLQALLGISQSTFQRMARSDDRLLVAGRARATRYAARRRIEGVRTPLPVHEVAVDGEIRHALTLHPVEPFGCWVEARVPDIASAFHETDPSDPGPDPSVDLPWFLLDAKPSGFLGRRWARAHVDQGWPADLARWTGDDVLRYATHYGTDLSGAFVVGGFAREQLERGVPAEIVREGTEPSAYAALAEQALAESPRGSSPGGDQPKFTAVVAGDGPRHCIVKFSPPMDTPGGRRWADLLAVEHVVHDVLRAHGVDACRSRLIDGGGRRFLEIERFDRHGERGRSGLVSLLALDRAGVASELRRWSLATASLVREGRLDPADHARVEWLEAFGHLIANTDMHPGNLSFRLGGTTILGLAPVYDMLPMFHAPRHGGELLPGVYVPSGEGLDGPASARAAALEVWDTVLGCSDVSEAFSAIAREQRAAAR